MKYIAAFLLTLLFIVGWSESRAATSALHIVQQSAYAINAIPVKMQWIPTAAGVAANSAQYATRAVAYTPAIVGAATRSFLLSPGGLALSAALIAAGYVIDELTGEVTEEGGTQLTTIKWTQQQTGAANVIACHGPDLATTATCFAAVYGASSGFGYTFESCDSYTTSPSLCHFPHIWDGTHHYQFFKNTVAPYEYEFPATVMTDSELGTLIDTDPFSPYLPDILTDPLTGKPYSNTALDDALADVEADFNAQYDTDPVTVPDTDPATNDDGLESQTDDLFDCDLFPTLCKWLTWFRSGEDLTLDETPPPNLNQEVDISTYADFEGDPISFGGASTCPAPYSVYALNETIELNYTPFCTLAEWLNPLLLAIATMIGIFYFTRIVSS